MAALTRSAHWIQNTTVPVSPPTSTLSETEDAFAADHGVDVKHAVQGLVLNVPLFLSNATVVFILLASGRFRQHGDWLILSLCAINVPMCGVVATIVLIKYFSGVYPGRYNVCYLQAFCIIFQNSVNLMTTVTLSLERCAAVTKPFWYRANVKENKLAIIFALVFIYTISAIYAILPIVSSEIGHVGLSYSFCNIPWTSPKNRTLSILTASLASVLVLTIFILDVLTAKAVLRGRQRRQCLNSRKSQRDAEEDSTTRVVLVVTGLYAIAFVPGTVSGREAVVQESKGWKE